MMQRLLASGPFYGALGFFLYSVYDTFMKFALAEYSIPAAGALSSMACILCIITYAALTRQLRLLKPRKTWVVAVFSLISLCGNFGFLYALPRMPFADIFVIILTNPLLLAVLANLLLKEHLSARQMVAMVIGFAGVMTMIQFWTIFSIDHSFAYNPWALAGAFTNWATTCIGGLFVRKFGPDENPLAMNLCSSFGFALFYGLMAGGEILVFKSNVMPELAVAGFIWFVAVAMLIKGFSIGPASLVAPMQYGQLLWAQPVRLCVLARNSRPMGVCGRRSGAGERLFAVQPQSACGGCAGAGLLRNLP